GSANRIEVHHAFHGEYARNHRARRQDLSALQVRRNVRIASLLHRRTDPDRGNRPRREVPRPFRSHGGYAQRVVNTATAVFAKGGLTAAFFASRLMSRPCL